ncbi:MAG: Gfo/Idh/MocA family oxidoreductase [Candidatus Bathyarchaeota archaeon]|nr:Gfo/Idh/MocA family oxidoreductase [Candidatus Bathyarchaeota archaeon]
MNHVRYAVIGLGRIGRLHCETLRSRVDKAELAAVCDVSEDLARSMGEKLRVAWYSVYSKVLVDPNIDAVIVATPTFTHKNIVLEALKEGKHVFVEKPLTPSSDEAREIVSAVGKRDLKVMVGYQRRFDYAYRDAKRRIEEGAIGRPVCLVDIARDPQPPSGWAADPRLSGGIFADMLTHDFDMARWLLDLEVSKVYVSGGSFFYNDLRIFGDVDFVNVMLEFEGGVQGFIQGCRRSVYGYDLRTEILGTDGTISIGCSFDHSLYYGTSDGVKFRGAPWFERRFYEAYIEELKSFTEAVLTDSTPQVTVEDGYKALCIADACWRSFREGKAIPVYY